MHVVLEIMLLNKRNKMTKNRNTSEQPQVFAFPILKDREKALHPRALFKRHKKFSKLPMSAPRKSDITKRNVGEDIL